MVKRSPLNVLKTIYFYVKEYISSIKRKNSLFIFCNFNI